MPVQYEAILEPVNDTFYFKENDTFLFLLKHKLWAHVRTCKRSML